MTDMTITREGDPIRDRAIRLFAFLREMTLLRTKLVRSVEEYDKAIWFAEIPREIGCYCAPWGARGDVEDHNTWIEVRKPKLIVPPEPPADLSPWLDRSQLADSAREYPDLREAITISEESNPDAAPVTAKLADHPEIKALWEHYVENNWWPWAEGDRRVQRVQTVYTDLFSVYQKQQRLAELYEVVVGLGLLTWKTTDGREIKRHIVTAQATLEFDTKRGIVTVGVGAEGAKLRLEQDMLDPQELPSAEHQNVFQDELLKAGDDIWGDDRVKAVIQGWITALGPVSRFTDNLDKPTTVDSTPQIHFAPALMLRRRTDRSLIQVFESIKQALESGHLLPEGVRRLVSIVEDDAGTTAEDGPRETDGANQSEIYFPLPANDEQLRIARRISTRSGVLVQGPPGTGKSHTIANLICHLLASGKRVLVTSQTPRALKVLRGKIPEPVKPLCVSLLGDDQEAMASLDDSVRGIIDRQVVWDRESSDQRVQQLGRELDLARKEEAETLSRLRAKREQETHVHHLPGGYDGTATKIGQFVRSSAKSYEWFEERPATNDKPPLTDSEASELLMLLRTIDEQKQRELSCWLVSPEHLLGPGVFAAHVQNESACRAAHTATDQHRKHASYELLKSTPRELRAQFRLAAKELRTEAFQLEKQADPWVPKAVKDMLGGKHHLWLDLGSLIRENLDSIGSVLKEIEALAVTGLEDRDIAQAKVAAERLLEHLKAGGGLGFLGIRSKVVKEGLFLIREVRVSGEPASSRQPLSQLLVWLGAMERLQHIDSHWQLYGDVPTGPLRARCAGYRNILAVLDRITGLAGRIQRARDAAGIAGLAEPTWNDNDALDSLLYAATAADTEEDLREACAPLDQLCAELENARLQPDSHNVNSSLFEAAKRRTPDNYANAHSALCRIWVLREQLERRRSLFDRLNGGLPKVAAELRSNYADTVWDNRLEHLSAAWNWARAQRWLCEFSDPGLEVNLSANLETQRGKVYGTLGALAAELAWQFCVSRLSEGQREHLVSWKKAVDRIGKGTGKYAEVHRRAARQHMEQCRPAITRVDYADLQGGGECRGGGGSV